MRTATIREAQHDLPSILRAVSRGEVVEITRRNRVVARLVPAAPRPAGGLPDFVARARAIWGRRPGGKPTSEIVIEARAERRGGFWWGRGRWGLSLFPWGGAHA